MRSVYLFNVLHYCGSCRRVYEIHKTTTSGAYQVSYYRDFPSIGKRHLLCPGCGGWKETIILSRDSKKLEKPRKKVVRRKNVIRKNIEKRPCLNCGELTTNKRFCSNSCSRKYQWKNKKIHIEHPCVYCDAPTTNIKYCSMICFRKDIKDRRAHGQERKIL